jgi:hypothetical protein
MLCETSAHGGASAMPKPTHQRYVVDSVVRAAKVLDAFTSSGETLRLRDVIERTGLSKGLCFRPLYTLHHCGFIEKVEVNRYRVTSDVRNRRRYRIGYADQGEVTSFPREVQKGLVRAAEQANVDRRATLSRRLRRHFRRGADRQLFFADARA